MGQHAFLAPSSAGIWGKPKGCRAYPLIEQMYPDEDSPNSLEGDACHEAGYLMIREGLRLLPHQVKPGQVMSNGVTLTQELYEAAEVYANDVVKAATKRQIYDGERVGLERHVGPSPNVHSTENHGTPDAWLFDRARGELIIWDAKFGFGLVEAYENWQGIDYAALLINHYGIDGRVDEYITIELRIIQPRAPHPEGPIRTWRVALSDLRGYINQLAVGAAECLEDDPPMRTGPHCRYCPGRHECVANQQAAAASVDESRRMALTEITPEAMSVELQILRRAHEALKHRLEGMEEQAKSMAQNGQKIPGYGVTPAYGREAWAVPDKEVYQLGQMFDVDLRQDKPITPKQARDKGIDSDVIKSYSEIPKRGLKLVEDDKTLAARVFKPKDGAQ